MRYLACLMFAACAVTPVEAVRFVHGAPAHGTPGPWALMGYRIGAHAMKTLGLTREQAFGITVTHRAPANFKYTCMVDGMMASTGASPGKMNLALEEVDDEAQLETIIEHKKTGARLRYTVTQAASQKFADTDYADFPTAAKALEAMTDEEIFAIDD